MVTGEAVVVEVRVAQVPSRAVAQLIDVAVQLVFLIAAFVVVGRFASIADSALAIAVSILFTVLVLVGYPVIFETLTRGRTLGKMALGLRVVSDDGGPERFRQALFRGLAGFPEIWMLTGAPALITSLISEKGKRLGDLFAGTIVISERAPRLGRAPVEMPPQLAGWASRLELSRLPAEVADTARQYLLRWHDLAPAVRHEMGVRIATQMASYVSPPPPAQVPPHAYLSAVLAERRHREEARLARRPTPHPTPSYGTGAYGNAAQAPAYGLGSRPAPYGAPPAPTPPQPSPYGPPAQAGPPSAGGRGPAASSPAAAPEQGPTPGGFVPPA
ncbi:hypothetical protein Misp01_04680 [Microtetraspora sp. NBRC 13810]|nr:hypothetical protein Misp01_04680 [Microtetraspora sp. NBRC 13810]